MALPNLIIRTKVPGLGPALKSCIGEAAFKLQPNASKKTTPTLLGWRNVHAEDAGPVGLRSYCKKCGKDDIVPITVDAEGKVMERPSKETGVFDVVGVCSREDIIPEWMDNLYYVYQKNVGQEASTLRQSLHQSGVALVGYVRFVGTADERPAAMFVTDYGATILTTLYFEDEVVSGIPIAQGDSCANTEKLSSAMSAALKSKTVCATTLERRELKTLPKESNTFSKEA